MSATVDVLLELERQGWDSLCDGTGHVFYGETMTADGVMVLADGSVMDRRAVVAALREAPAWSSYVIEDARLVGAGPDSACLVYAASAHRGDEPPFRAIMSSVYVRVDDRWRLALYQQTPMVRPVD